MDLSKYKCNRDPHDWRDILNRQMGCKEVKGFINIKTKKDFDLTKYKGEFPLGVILNKTTVAGWTLDTTATNVAELEPWLSNPPFRYLWGTALPVYETSYKETILQLNHRCVQLTDPPDILNRDEIYFETSRHILWHVVLATQCITIDRLADLEVDYMKQLIGTTPEIIPKCHELYNLAYPTVECLEEWIRKQYKDSRLPNNYVIPDYMFKIQNAIKNMLE